MTRNLPGMLLYISDVLFTALHLYNYYCNYCVFIYVYTYICICEQNDPCSGCNSTRFRIPCVLRLPAFQWHATEARLIFLVLGHLSQRCVGE